MTYYVVKCPQCRKQGAIGVFYREIVMILARDAAHAEELFREDYECNAPVTVRVENAH